MVVSVKPFNFYVRGVDSFLPKVGWRRVTSVTQDKKFEFRLVRQNLGVTGIISGFTSRMRETKVWGNGVGQEEGTVQEGGREGKRPRRVGGRARSG